jgi:hypothetical protein
MRSISHAAAVGLVQHVFEFNIPRQFASQSMIELCRITGPLPTGDLVRKPRPTRQLRARFETLSCRVEFRSPVLSTYRVGCGLAMFFESTMLIDQGLLMVMFLMCVGQCSQYACRPPLRITAIRPQRGHDSRQAAAPIGKPLDSPIGELTSLDSPAGSKKHVHCPAIGAGCLSQRAQPNDALEQIQRGCVPGEHKDGAYHASPAKSAKSGLVGWLAAAERQGLARTIVGRRVCECEKSGENCPATSTNRH